MHYIHKYVRVTTRQDTTKQSKSWKTPSKLRAVPFTQTERKQHSPVLRASALHVSWASSLKLRRSHANVQKLKLIQQTWLQVHNVSLLYKDNLQMNCSANKTFKNLHRALCTQRCVHNMVRLYACRSCYDMHGIQNCIPWHDHAICKEISKKLHSYHLLWNL